jgi:release factor glutamine methyltransferase
VVAPGVFVPRVRSELLVRCALDHVAGRARCVVVDLCCGSGALGAAIVDGAAPGAPIELHASDVDPVAAACARENVEPRGGTVHVGDLDEPLPAGLRGRVDVLVANVPYVASADIATLPTEAREHEPLVALDGGDDGLDLLRRVAATAAPWLAPDGIVLFEVAPHQLDAARRAVENAGLVPVVHSDDELEAQVVTGAR